MANLMIAIVPLALACGMGPATPQPTTTAAPPDRVRLATTTSTDDSGLTTWLFEPYQERTGVEVQVVAVGTGQALELGRRGDADLVLVHARSKEDEFVEQGWGIDRRDILWNDFVVAGPAADPAGVRGSTDVADAFHRIRQSGAPFVSRGDDSGTHVREQAIWELVGGPPADSNTYLDAGQGMGKSLLLASEKQSYILSDRGTWIAFASKLDLDLLLEGDPELRNPYGIILVNPVRQPHVNASGARALRDWLVSPEGQQRIDDFRVDGKALFHPGADPR